MLDELTSQVLFDGIHRTPQLLQLVRTRIDCDPRKHGRWLLTGSNEARLMQVVSKSLPGRAAILQLLPVSASESPRVNIFTGGYPEVVATPRVREMWFSSYIQTYLERDVRAMVNVHDLVTFRRFLAMVASRHGQVLNKSDLAAPLGLSVPTIGQWLHVLEVTGQIIVVPPYFENFGKRLIKSPKIYIGDSGLACHLLGIQTIAEMNRSPFLGPLFEGFIAAEILKSQINTGRRKELYFFRDRMGLEVDFLFPGRGGQLWVVECKASKTLQPSMANQLLSLSHSMKGKQPRMIVVNRSSPSAPAMTALRPGVEALNETAFVKALNETRGSARAAKRL